jgi:hypothetical protein
MFIERVFRVVVDASGCPARVGDVVEQRSECVRDSKAVGLWDAVAVVLSQNTVRVTEPVDGSRDVGLHFLLVVAFIIVIGVAGRDLHGDIRCEWEAPSLSWRGSEEAIEGRLRLDTAGAAGRTWSARRRVTQARCGDGDVLLGHSTSASDGVIHLARARASVPGRTGARGTARGRARSGGRLLGGGARRGGCSARSAGRFATTFWWFGHWVQASAMLR